MKRTDSQKRLSARLTHRKAFTLVELLVVIAIIGILFVVLISKVDFATDKAKTAGAQTDLRSYELAAYTIGVEQQGFTSDLELLAEQLNKNLDPKLHLNVDGGHITTEAKDPWGKEYRITYNEPDSSRGQIIITSAGVDTKYDTEDDINIIITYTVDEDGGHVEIEMSNGVVNPAPDTPTEPSDPTDPDTPTEPEQGGEQEPVRLAAGLYDAEDNLVASWDELVNTYGMNIEKDYTYSTYKTNAVSPYYVLTNYDALSTGTKLVISDDSEKVGSYAFYHFSGLTSVVIGNSISSIGDSAFFGCSGLTSVEIGNGVTNIGVSAFRGCLGLTSVTMGDGVTSIETQAFYGCTGLQSVTIGDGVTKIGIHAFQNCSGLTGVYITNLTTWCQIDFSSNDANPLYYAKNLYLNNAPITNLMIPDEITEIKQYAFYNAQNIAGTLTIPDSVTTIDSAAFSGCSGITGDIIISNNVTNIGDSAFYECKGLTSVAIGNSVVSIGENSFSGCSGLTGVYITDLTAWCQIDFKSASSNPLNNAKNLYLNNAPINNLVIPDEITEIKNHTFFNAYNVTGTLTIHDGVTSIGDYAFRDCSGLTNVTIPDSVTSIGEKAFYECKGLTSVTIGNGIITIGTNAFLNCTALTGVYITDLTAWCQIDFKSASSNPLNYAKKLYLNNALITNLVIPDEITEIKQYTFYNAKNITGTLTIHDGVTSIGDYAFSGCSGLTSVAIGNSVVSIGENPFSKCSGLTGVYITDLTTWCQIDFGSDKANPLYYAKNLYLNNQPITNLVIPAEVTQIKQYTFYNAQNIKSVTIHDNVTSVGEYAFCGCSGLTSVVIPDSVTSIGSSAFSGCSGLVDVEIGTGITEIKTYAFKNCSNIKDVLFKSTTFISYDYIFYGCSSIATICVNPALVDSYKTASGWSSFASKIQAIPTT